MPHSKLCMIKSHAWYWPKQKNNTEVITFFTITIPHSKLYMIKSHDTRVRCAYISISLWRIVFAAQWPVHRNEIAKTFKSTQYSDSASPSVCMCFPLRLFAVWIVFLCVVNQPCESNCYLFHYIVMVIIFRFNSEMEKCSDLKLILREKFRHTESVSKLFNYT